MGEQQRPLMAVVATEPDAVPLEVLEEDFLREGLEFAGRWVRRLPTSSRWHGMCLTLHRVASEALERRGLRLAALR